MKVRREPWGAWVKIDDPPALAALDVAGARALGVEPRAQGHVSAPIELHVAVTSRCAAGCEGCYLDARADGAHVARESLDRTLDAAARVGVFTVAFGGGEPTTRVDLGDLARAARARGLTPVVTTSGLGLTDDALDALAAFSQVNVSYDGPGDAYESVRGFRGARGAERAIQRLAAAGVRVGVNVVLTRATFASLGETLARARELGAREAQLLRYKPEGRAASLGYLDKRLAPRQAEALGPTLRELVRAHTPDFRVRIDCALVPFLSADPELYGDPARLARFGVMGCEAGQALSAVRADGHVSPCSFAPPIALEGRALEGHARDPDLTRLRAFARAPPEPCGSCAIAPVCKGGCRVVSRFGGDALRPDPECPRVRSAAGSPARADA